MSIDLNLYRFCIQYKINGENQGACVVHANCESTARHLFSKDCALEIVAVHNWGVVGVAV